jgi:20S proteasome subunit beta 4
MDSLIGICGKDWVVLASDATCAHSVLVVKGDEDKIFGLDDDKLIGCQGDDADRAVFCEYVQKNVALYSLRNGGIARLSTHAVACWVREQLATAIREGMYYSNILIAGVAKPPQQPAATATATTSTTVADPASLYFVDYLGSVQRLNFAAHGYASHFVLGLLDRHYRPDMTFAEGEQLARACVHEVQQRLALNAPRYILRAVTRDGIIPLKPEEGSSALPPTRDFFAKQQQQQPAPMTV